MPKALYANRNMAEPPYGHNLPTLASKINEITFEKSQSQLLTEITAFNIAGRYDDYKNDFFRLYSAEFVQEYYTKGEELIQWLKSRLR
jgi:HEPN domain-containing protein